MAPRNYLTRITRLVLTLLILAAVCYAREVSVEEARKKKKPSYTAIQSKEASIPNFVRLVAMRLVFGLAYMVGLGDWASGLFNGALPPPGSDYSDDYGDYGGDEDYGDDY